jgi:DNA-binding NtrC family response regulator
MPKRGNVLVVEDDPNAREAIRSVLKQEYDVFVAESGAQALKILSSVHIDTVTLEPWLPGLQGREILKRIREVNPAARVIIVTGQRLSVWFDDMVREEIFDYLPKPFDRRDLLRTVARSLVRQQPRVREMVPLRRGA